MTQYIDKDALIAEIDRQKIGYNVDGKHSVEYDTTRKILNILNTLEVKEVDLEKEIESSMNNLCELGCYAQSLLNNPEDYEGFAKPFPKEVDDEIANFARLFFELGLKTKTPEEIKIGETEIYLNDDGGEPPYDGMQRLDLSCTEYEIPTDKFKDGENVEIIIRRAQKGE